MKNCSVQPNCALLENIDIAEGVRSMTNNLISRSFT